MEQCWKFEKGALFSQLPPFRYDLWAVRYKKNELSVISFCPRDFDPSDIKTFPQLSLYLQR